MGLMAELQHFQNCLDALVSGCSFAAAHPQPQFQVFANTEVGEKGIALKHHANPAVFRWDVVHLSAIDADRAAIGLIEPRNQAESGTFATTAWS
jgi:hypothetical protein